MDAPSLKVFKAKLDGPWTAWSAGCQFSPWEGTEGQWSLKSIPTQAIM